MESSQPLMEAVYHEAGHAVAAHDRGATIQAIEIFAEDDPHGNTNWDRETVAPELLWESKWLNGLDVASIENYARAQARSVVYWAGPIAQRRFSQAEEIDARSRGDVNMLIIETQNAAINDEDLLAFRQAARRWTETAVAGQKYWLAIERLANVILERVTSDGLTIDGKEAHAIIAGELAKSDAPQGESVHGTLLADLEA